MSQERANGAEVLEGGSRRAHRLNPRLTLGVCIALAGLAAVATAVVRTGGGGSPAPTPSVGATTHLPGYPVCAIRPASKRFHGPIAALVLSAPSSSLVDNVPEAGRDRHRVIHEVWYDSATLGLAGEALGGLVYTGITDSGRFDRWVASTGAEPSGSVWGVPAYVSPVFGGNGALAWKPMPHLVAYVGYSGSALSPRTTHALRCLASNTRPLTPKAWHHLG